MVETIFVPRGAEARAVRAALTRERSDARIVATGIGPRAAARAADDALAAARFGTALVTGLCGALSPAFVVGDVLAYREIRAPGERPLLLERSLGDALAARVAGAQSGVRGLAGTSVVTHAADKLALGVRFGADAVDMESRALADRLGRAGVAVAVVRVVSDGAHDELPDLARALDGSGGMDGFALALAMIGDPLAGVRLARSGLRALRALRDAVAAIVRR